MIERIRLYWLIHYYWRRLKCFFGNHFMVGVLKNDPWEADEDEWNDVDYYYCLNCRKGER